MHTISVRPFGLLILAVICFTFPDVALSAQLLSLSQAVDNTLAYSPQLKSAAANKAAYIGAQRQAGALPNPELSFEAENVAGRGDYKGFNAAEITVGASQLIEIGGKRSARQRMATEDLKANNALLVATQQDVVANVKDAYMAAVAADEQVLIAQQQKNIAASMLKTVTIRVNSAADPVFQKNKAQVAYSMSVLALDVAKKEATIAKQKLLAFWHDPENTSQIVDLDRAPFLQVTPLKKPQNILALIQASPYFQQWAWEHKRSEAALDLEKANIIPDPIINVGVKDFRENNDQAFVVGVSLPLPVLNQNLGAVEKARQESSKAASDKQAALADLATTLNQHFEELDNAYQVIKSIKQDILPAAEQAYTSVKNGHSRGKFMYLEVLDAQRSLFDVKQQYNTALLNYHQHKNSIERFTINNTQQRDLN